MADQGGQKQEAFPPVPKVRNKKPPHAHHGGAWKVAYADFITTMMALFLLLWLLASSDQASRVMLSLYFRDPGIFENPQGKNMVPGSGAAPKTKKAPILEVAGSGGGGQANTENTIDMEKIARALHRQLAETGPKRGAERQVSMVVTKNGIQIQLSDSGERNLFLEGSAVMTRETKRIVSNVGAIISALVDFTVTVEGHTNSVPPKSLKYNNRELSADRAQRVMQMLVAEGVPSERFRGLAGYGDTWPLDEQNRMSPFNSRIVITLRARSDSNQKKRGPAVPATIPSDDFGEIKGGTPAPASSRTSKQRSIFERSDSMGPGGSP